LVILTETYPNIPQNSTKNKAINTQKGTAKVKKGILILLMCALLSGCRPQKQTDVASHIVTEITITWQADDQLTHRYYNTHKKMQQILLYLRSVSPGFTPDEDPETLGGQEVRITLRRADGSAKVYRQKNDRYLQEEANPWKQIKPEWGASLYQIVLENESDP
jgi:hypothetical protein